MSHFFAIDFETANPKRFSACSFGYAKVFNDEIVDSKGYLIKPVGGHSWYQSNIHGITEKDTFDKPYFNQLWDDIHDIFDAPLIGHSLFDQQVLNALSYHFNFGLSFDYTDTFSFAQKQLPHLRNWKLITLAKYLDIPVTKHHDAMEDAILCAKIFLKLQGSPRGIPVKP